MGHGHLESCALLPVVRQVGLGRGGVHQRHDLVTIDDIRAPSTLTPLADRRIGVPHTRITGLQRAHCVENARSGGCGQARFQTPRRTSGGLTGNRLGQVGSSKRIWSPATSVGGASSWWNRQRVCMTCVTFSGTRTSRRPRGTCGVRPCDWLKRWNGWKRQQASLTMPMSGINWRQCAEVFGNIGTLLEQTHRRQTACGLAPA